MSRWEGKMPHSILAVKEMSFSRPNASILFVNADFISRMLEFNGTSRMSAKTDTVSGSFFANEFSLFAKKKIYNCIELRGTKWLTHPCQQKYLRIFSEFPSALQHIHSFSAQLCSASEKMWPHSQKLSVSRDFQSSPFLSRLTLALPQLFLIPPETGPGALSKICGCVWFGFQKRTCEPDKGHQQSSRHLILKRADYPLRGKKCFESEFGGRIRFGLFEKRMKFKKEGRWKKRNQFLLLASRTHRIVPIEDSHSNLMTANDSKQYADLPLCVFILYCFFQFISVGLESEKQDWRMGFAAGFGHCCRPAKAKRVGEAGFDRRREEGCQAEKRDQEETPVTPFCCLELFSQTPRSEWGST